MRSSFKAPVTNLESIIALILFLLQGGGHSPPDQGEQLGSGPQGWPDLRGGRQQQRPARHLPEGTSRMEWRVSMLILK